MGIPLLPEDHPLPICEWESIFLSENNNGSYIIDLMNFNLLDDTALPLGREVDIPLALLKKW